MNLYGKRIYSISDVAKNAVIVYNNPVIIFKEIFRIMNNGSCRLFKRCGGCQLDASYDSQLEYKQAKVKRLIGKYVPPAPIIGMDTPYYYRNKVQHGFYTNTNRKTISGILQAENHEDLNLTEVRL